ncbi:MAG TPA: hypothetical protein VM032_05730 [Vicinamibacterales bacterium]|nr:hypothetical protein [Vicinamibacterales bacterium]
MMFMSLVAAACLIPGVAAFQARGGAAGPGIRACAILTRDLVEPFTENKRVLDLIPPEEETTGTSSACEYGVVRLQHSPVRPGGERTAPKDFAPLAGVGEKAFFRSNRNEYAELVVWSGAHYITLQVSVPTGSTAEAIKPKTVALANAVLRKLQ